MEHRYEVSVRWTGNLGRGTERYDAYARKHEISVAGKPVLAGSSDPSFRGDASRYNPEDLLVASLSACHMLWYLHLCAVEGVNVLDYTDDAAGRMRLEREGGRFTEVVLRPRVVVAHAAMVEAATDLHARAHAACFIAASVNFPVRHEPVVSVGEGRAG